MAWIIILTVPGVLITGWVLAEAYGKRWMRIALGFATIVSVGWSVGAYTLFSWSFESTMHRSSLQRATEMLEAGQTNKVVASFRRYEAVARTNGTYKAARILWGSLNHD